MNGERLLNRFLRYVQCDSESKDELQFCEMVAADLQYLGMEVTRDRKAGELCGSNGFNIYARRPGVGDPILFSAHLDTVSPGKGIKPLVTDGKITSSGGTILGADDKCGIAAVLEAVESIIEEGCAARPVEVYFTVCEEIGLLGSRHGNVEMIQAKQAVVLDSGTPGEIINQSPVLYRLQVRVQGKATHAAASPEKGVHALKAAAQIVYETSVGRLDEQSVRNISNFLSPGATNVVADKASFDVEIRSLNDAVARKYADEVLHVTDHICKGYGATYDIDCNKEFEVLHVPENSPLIASLKRCMKATGRKAKIQATMGGSDAVNLAARANLEAVNIGTGMQNAHGVEECMQVEDLEWLCRLVHSLVTSPE